MQPQEKTQKVPRPIAQAIVQCLTHLPGIETIAGSYWYGATSIATQLRWYGIMVRIDEEVCEMIIGDNIRLPLYGRRALRSEAVAIGPERLRNTYPELMVRGDDLAFVVYRYCFGDPLDIMITRPHVLSGAFWERLYELIVTALAALRAFWRLLTLLTPFLRALGSKT